MHLPPAQGGAQFKELQARSGADIFIVSEECPPGLPASQRLVAVVGQLPCVLQAVSSILTIVDGSVRRSLRPCPRARRGVTCRPSGLAAADGGDLRERELQRAAAAAGPELALPAAPLGLAAA